MGRDGNCLTRPNREHNMFYIIRNFLKDVKLFFNDLFI